MHILTIIILTLVVYSGIATILYLIFDKEDVLIYFGWGIIGFTVSAISFLLSKAIKFFKYEFGKRTIFEDTITGQKYKCKTKEWTHIFDINGLRLITRYAKKSECKDIPDFPL